MVVPAGDLRADPALDGAAVDELLRFDSPVQMTLRIATKEIAIGGRDIDPGTIVILCTGAANRDASFYDHPDQLDWHRANNPHQAFGAVPISASVLRWHVPRPASHCARSSIECLTYATLENQCDGPASPYAG